MNRILVHPTFRGSKRCVALLTYLVDQALAGEEEGIKERTLGIEVFERSPDYDTNGDPIVRRTANEIRKRLGQYYFEPHGNREVTIHMDRGNYLLEFEFDRAAPFPVLAQIENDSAEAEFPNEPIKPARLFQPAELAPEVAPPISKLVYRGWILAIAATLIATFGGFLFLRSNTSSSPEYKLWKPLLDSNDRITVIVSDSASVSQIGGATAPQALTRSPISHGPREDTPFLDTRVAQAISMRLMDFKRKANLQPSSTLTFQDFRLGPTIIVGGTINPWASILLSKLRYTLRFDPVSLDKWIEDSQNPSARNWKIDGQPQVSDNFVDYAVVTRYFNKDTGQWVMALSGLEAHGTEAAGELVCDPEFVKSIPSGLQATGNFQIVLKVPVLRGSTGPFEVLTIYTW